MKTLWKHTAVAAVMLVGGTFTMPGTATAVDATLYELTENMGLDNLQNPTVRTAMAALQGTAQVDTPLCPPALIRLLQTLQLLAAPQPCTVTAIGTDEINLKTGAGTLKGKFAVVLNADNAVDGAELVVMEGDFEGKMQLLVDASGTPLPLIAIPCSGPDTCGTLTPTSVLGVPLAHLGYYFGSYFPGLSAAHFPASAFGGVFRLPFVLSKGKKDKPRRHADAVYLTDNGNTIRVKKDELSLGMPTVRVEITFAP